MKLGSSLLVVALVAAGSFVACTATVNNGPGSVDSDSGSDASTTADTSIKKDSSTADTGPVVTCGPTAVTSTQLAALVRPNAAPQRGACTDVEIAAVATKWVDSAASFQNVSDAMVGTCRTCLVTDVASDADALKAATWNSFVIVSPKADGKGFTHFISNEEGRCGTAIGNSAACTERRNEYAICGDASCSECTEQADADQCFADAYGDANADGTCDKTVDFTPCDKTAVDAYSAGCVDADQTKSITLKLNAACGPIAK